MVIFENESLEELIKLNKHCIHKDYINYLERIETERIVKEKDNYKISIIIPNYNYAKWINKCLSSIEKQTYKNYEVIFIDDLSTDNSIEIAKEFINRIPIKIVKLKQKRYNGGARNEGYLYISKDTDYIWYLDSDDWLKDEHVLEKINDNLGADVLFIGIGTDINGIMNQYFIPKYEDRYKAIEGWSGSCAKVIRKELALNNLYQEGTLKEDRTQHYKICIHMKNFSLLKEIVYIWNRNNTQSVTTIRNTKWKADTIRNWADAVEMYETEKGKDIKIDRLLLKRIEACKNEVLANGDSQQ